MTHTPGPWTLSEGSERVTGRRITIHCDGMRIADVIPWSGRWSAAEANAHLIAAAPELLEGLVALIAKLDAGGIPMSEDACPTCATTAGPCDETCALEHARAAIAKAVR